MHLFRRDDEAFLFDPATSFSFGLDAPGEAAARLVIAAGWGVPAADDRAIRAALWSCRDCAGAGTSGPRQALRLRLIRTARTDSPSSSPSTAT